MHGTEETVMPVIMARLRMRPIINSHGLNRILSVFAGMR